MGSREDLAGDSHDTTLQTPTATKESSGSDSPRRGTARLGVRPPSPWIVASRMTRPDDLSQEERHELHELIFNGDEFLNDLGDVNL
jgi:hypothetical protein